MTLADKIHLAIEAEQLAKSVTENLVVAKSLLGQHTGHYNKMIASEDAASEAAKRAAILLETIARE